MSDKNSQQPWICPKCGRTYAPWVASCFYCGQQHNITYTNPCPWYPWWYCNGGIYCSKDQITNSTTTTTTSKDFTTLNANQFTSANNATTLKN